MSDKIQEDSPEKQVFEILFDGYRRLVQTPGGRSDDGVYRPFETFDDSRAHSKFHKLEALYDGWEALLPEESKSYPGRYNMREAFLSPISDQYKSLQYWRRLLQLYFQDKFGSKAPPQPAVITTYLPTEYMVRLQNIILEAADPDEELVRNHIDWSVFYAKIEAYFTDNGFKVSKSEPVPIKDNPQA